MIRAKSLPFYYQANGWQGLNFVPYDSVLRNNLIFPSPETLLEESLQACIRRFLPTVFIENYSVARKYTQEKLPKYKLMIGVNPTFLSSHNIQNSKIQFLSEYMIHRMFAHFKIMPF